MDVKWINPFLEATINVIKTMAFVEPRAGKPFLKKGSKAHGDVSGIIGLTGGARGSLAISFNEGCILNIVSNMLGETITSLDSDINDAVGEITNMVSGAARKLLEKEGFNISAAIPTVVSGRDHTIVHVLGGPSIIIPFETDAGTFVLDICLSEAKK